MLIEKVTLIQFDEVSERARIERLYTGARATALLALLDAFVAGDFAHLYNLARQAEPGLIGYLAIPISAVLDDVHTQVLEQAAAVRGVTISKADQQHYAQRGIAFGPEAVEYPKFFVRGGGGVSTPTTVPNVTEL